MCGRQFEHLPAISAGLVHRDSDAVLDEKVRHRRDVGQIGDILESQRIRGQQAHGHQRQRRILGAANRNYALERHTALDPDLVHRFGSTRRLPARRRSSAMAGCFYWSGGAAQAGGSRSRSGSLGCAASCRPAARRCSLRRRRFSRNALASRSSRAARSAAFPGVRSRSGLSHSRACANAIQPCVEPYPVRPPASAG